MSCFRKHLGKKSGFAGFYTKLNVWGSLGLIFDYDGGPIIENGDPIFLNYIWTFHEGIRTDLLCQLGVEKHQVIFVSQRQRSTICIDLTSYTAR